MPEDRSFSLSSLLDSTASLFIGFGKRLFVHLCSLIAATLIAAAAWPGVGVATGLCAYAGLICLIPRSTLPITDRIIPSAAGAALMLFWTVAGVPWQFTFLWGGLTAWGLRLISRRGAMGWEGLALPLLLIALTRFFAALAPLCPATPPYWSLPVFMLLGWGARWGYARVRGGALRREMLQRACLRLEQKLTSGVLPETLRIGAEYLAKQGRSLAGSGIALEAKDDALVTTMAELAEQIGRVGGNSPHGALKGLEARTSACNQSLHERLEEIRRQKPAQERSVLDVRLDDFEQSARELLRKAGPLPRDIRDPLLGIGAATEQILQCMREDPNDVAPGDRFLSRYLKAAHTVVDEHTRLSGQPESAGEMADLLGRSRDLLKRLEAAFVQEHASLLRNDAVNFTAELNVLDKLLKMDGK